MNKSDALWQNRCMVRLILALAALPTIALGDTEIRGHVFTDKIDANKPSFTYVSRISESGGKTKVVNTYADAAGKLVVYEETETQNDRLTGYKYRQHQVNDEGFATFPNDKIEMQFTEEGKTEKDAEDHQPLTIVPAMIEPLLKKNWDMLMKGDSLHVRYLAIERLETIGFKFFKDEERTLRGKAVVDILMKPSSFFIAALVSPIRITMLKDAPHTLIETEGRTPIRLPKVNPPAKRGDWKAIDARVEYDPPKTVK